MEPFNYMPFSSSRSVCLFLFFVRILILSLRSSLSNRRVSILTLGVSQR